MIIVARGQRELIRELRSIFGSREPIVEDRREEGVLLPREWRQARPVPWEARGSFCCPG